MHHDDKPPTHGQVTCLTLFPLQANPPFRLHSKSVLTRIIVLHFFAISDNGAIDVNGKVWFCDVDGPEFKTTMLWGDQSAKRGFQRSSSDMKCSEHPNLYYNNRALQMSPESTVPTSGNGVRPEEFDMAVNCQV